MYQERQPSHEGLEVLRSDRETPGRPGGDGAGGTRVAQGPAERAGRGGGGGGRGGGEKEAGPGTARGFLDTHTGLTVYFVSLKTNVSKDFLHDLVF